MQGDILASFRLYQFNTSLCVWVNSGGKNFAAVIEEQFQRGGIREDTQVIEHIQAQAAGGPS